MPVEPDPSSVHAGYLPLALTVLLLAFLAVLFFWMRRHLRRAAVDLPSEAEVREAERAERRVAAEPEGVVSSEEPAPAASAAAQDRDDWDTYRDDRA